MPILFTLPLALLIVAAVIDARRHEIPDAVPLVLLAWAVLAPLAGWHPDPGWSQLGGFAVGAGAGVLLFALGAWGGGDAKLAAALGATLGVKLVLAVFFWVALAGGLLAGWALLRRRQGRRIEVAYAPAFAFGTLVVALSYVYGGLTDAAG